MKVCVKAGLFLMINLLLAGCSSDKAISDSDKKAGTDIVLDNADTSQFSYYESDMTMKFFTNNEYKKQVDQSDLWSFVSVLHCRDAYTDITAIMPDGTNCVISLANADLQLSDFLIGPDIRFVPTGSVDSTGFDRVHNYMITDWISAAYPDEAGPMIERLTDFYLSKNADFEYDADLYKVFEEELYGTLYATVLLDAERADLDRRYNDEYGDFAFYNITSMQLYDPQGHTIRIETMSDLENMMQQYSVSNAETET